MGNHRRLRMRPHVITNECPCRQEEADPTTDVVLPLQARRAPVQALRGRHNQVGDEIQDLVSRLVFPVF